MEDSSYIGGIVVGVAYLVAGFRLARLGAQPHEVPERLLAATFLLWGSAYACWQIPIILKDEYLFTPLYVAARILTDSGSIASAFFLRRVFRPNSRFASALVATIAIGVLIGVVGSGWVGDWEAVYPLRNPWWWMEWTAIVASVAWIGVEGLHHYGMSRRRQRLGLCDALTSNRYLLWGLAGTVWTVYEFAHVIQQIEFEVTGTYSALLDGVASALETTPIVLIYLIFFPPAAYRRWIERTASAPETAKG